MRVGLDKDRGYCHCVGDSEFYDRESGLLVVLSQELHRDPTFLDSPRDLQGIDPALFQIVHEFTHSITSPETGRYIDLIIEPLEIGEEGLQGLFSSQFKWPPQYKYAYELPSPIVIPAFLDFPQAYYERPGDYVAIDSKVIVPKDAYFTLGKKYFQQNASEFSEAFADEPRLLSAKSTLSPKTRLGYGARNAEEFLSVAAEIYIRGRDQFIKSYEPFLGRERAEKLYEGVKQEIFRGREY